MDKEEILAEARIRYPVGTVFRLAHLPNKVGTVSHTNYKFGTGDNVYSDPTGEAINGCVYYNGEWAEIISRPEQILQIY